MQNPLQGKKLADDEWPVNPGEYSKVNGKWYAVSPDGSGPIGLTGFRKPWNVTENTDGTITVNPSIRVLGAPGQPDLWHGYLIKGIWTKQ